MDFDVVVAEGLERWLKKRRDEYKRTEVEWYALDSLLDESRECSTGAFFPWSEENKTYRERD